MFTLIKLTGLSGQVYFDTGPDVRAPLKLPWLNTSTVDLDECHSSGRQYLPSSVSLFSGINI